MTDACPAPVVRPSPGRLRALALLPALIWFSACGSHAGAASTTYYIDFEHGSDEASGLTEAQAWKHAPGDPQAQGGPGRAMLQPGDKVLFRGGVVYRGAIRLDQSGAEGRPITYAGQGFGTGRAIISGRDPVKVQVRACETAPGCAGLATAAELRMVELPQAVRPSDQVLVGGRMLNLAQTPDQPDRFWYDDLRHYQPASRSDLTMAGDRWRLRNGFIRKSLGDAPVGDLVVEVWGQPNAIASAPAESYDPAASAVVMRSSELKPYDDRDTLFALANHPALIRAPYDFATLDRGARLVVKAPLAVGEGEVEVSRRGVAFTLGEVRHVAIEGFDIQGFAGPEKAWGSGSALFSEGRPAEDVTFRDNEVHDLTSWAGSGAVQISNISRAVVSDNRFFRLWRGAGVMLGGKSQDIRIQRNSFDQVGRTGMLVIGAKRVWIDHNRLVGLWAHHGNGLSVYLNNQDVLISNNLIRDTPRGITFQGPDIPNGEPNRIVIRRNLILATREESFALQSWGGDTKGVTIEGNALLVKDGGYALGLTGVDKTVVVRRNLVSAMRVGGEPPADWVVQDNVFMGDNYIVSADAGAAWARTNKDNWGLAGPASALLATPPRAAAKVCAALLGDNAPPTGLDWLTPDERASLTKGVGPDDLCAP